MSATGNWLSSAMFVIAAAVCCAPAGAAPIERVSVSSDEVEGNGKSYYPSVSDNGRFVALCSSADNLVPGDTNGVEDIFVRDRLNGTTERVSVSSSEVQGNGANCGARLSYITADGRFVAFSSSATNLVVNDTNGAIDTFVRDRQAGTTQRVSVGSQEQQANQGGSAISISADGRFVVFHSLATNLTPAAEKGTFIRDRQLGTTEWSGGDGVLSAHRRFAAFVRYNTDGHADWREIHVRDRLIGTTEHVGKNGGSISWNPDISISADGRFVPIYSYYLELSVFDRKAGVTQRVDDGIYFLSTHTMRISANGRFVVFDGLVDGPGAAGTYDVFVRDLLTRTTEKLTDDPSTMPTFGDGILSISADGSFVAFTSDAAGLVSGDTNNEFDVFVSDFVREPRKLLDGRNDLLVAFGGQGLWQRLNDGQWTRIGKAASPAIIAAADLDGSIRDEAILGYTGQGLFSRDNKVGILRKLHDSVPARLVAADFDGNGLDDLAADFGAQGLWIRVNKKPWEKVHASATRGLRSGDLDGDGEDELIANFGGDGLWSRYNHKGWIKLQSGSPIRMATGDLDGNGYDELIAEFGTALFAFYNDDPPFVRLPNGRTEGLATGDLDGNGQDEILADFGSRGLWAYYNNTAPWVRLDPPSPTNLLATDLDQDGKEDVVGDFGSAGLLVRYNNAGAFRQIREGPSRAIAAGGFN